MSDEPSTTGAGDGIPERSAAAPAGPAVHSASAENLAHNLTRSHPRDRVDERLERALAIALEHCDHAEVSFRGDALDLLRLANADVTLAGRVERAAVSIRAVVPPAAGALGEDGAAARPLDPTLGAAGLATTTDLGDDGLRHAARAAVSAAREASRHVGLDTAVALPVPTDSPAAPSPLSPPGLALAHLDARSKLAWLAGPLRAHRRDQLDLAGRFHTGVTTRAIRSSRGVVAYHQAPHADLLLVSLERPSGRGASASRRLLEGHIDAESVAAMAETTRRECHEVRALPVVEADALTGDLDVVLSPRALGLLLGWLATITWSTRAVDDGFSRFLERRGERVASERITLVDDAARDGLEVRGVPVPFDAEGIARQPTAIISRGIARGIPTDSHWARRRGDRNTGHAARGSLFSGSGSRARHLVMERGEHAEGALVGELEHGLEVSNLHYVNGLVNPRETVMTGLFRDATFVVRGGARVGAVRSGLRFTDRMLAALGRVDGATRTRRAVASGHRTEDSYVLPGVRIRGLAVGASSE